LLKLQYHKTLRQVAKRPGVELAKYAAKRPATTKIRYISLRLLQLVQYYI